MATDSPRYRFQAAVERPLSLARPNPNGQMESRDYIVTVVAERVGLDELDVVMDFRILEVALDSALGPIHGHSLHELGMDEPLDAVKKIAEVLIPSMKPPVKLAAVSLRDEAGRGITLRL
jgi:hypothetical protein